jgi:hypothetical protein
MLTSAAPFIFYSWPFHPYKLLIFGCLAVMILDILFNRSILHYDYKTNLIIFIQFVFILLISIYKNDLFALNLLPQFFAILIVYVYIYEFISFPTFLNNFIFIIIITGIGGIIILMGHIFYGIEPLFTVDYSESGTSYFLGLTTTNVYINYADLKFIRYSGFFDEPGTFGLYTSIAIISNKLFIKKKSNEILLIIVGIFCFSLAFYFFLFLYFILFYLNKKNIFKFLFISFFIFSFFTFLYTNKENDVAIEKIYSSTFERLQFKESGELQDDSRSSRMKIDKKNFTDNILFGTNNIQNVLAANLYSIPAKYGIIGTIFYYLLFLYLIVEFFGLNSILSAYNKSIILMLLILYHRPEVLSFFISLIFIAFILTKKHQTNNFYVR